MLLIGAAEGEKIMKNKKKAALAVMSVVLLLEACGINSEQSVTSSEMVAPEVSSQDLLVSSLEYLLLDDTQENVQDTDQQDPQEQEPEMQDAQSKSIAEESENVSEEQIPSEEEMIAGEEVVIYYGNGGSSSLNQEKVVIEEITPEELINALAMHNIVSLDTKVLAFDQGEQDGALMLYLDLSRSAGGYLQTMSKEAECIIIASVINTFLENYGADAICLTVEGEPLGTSHTEYVEPIGRCTPEELMEMLESSNR